MVNLNQLKSLRFKDLETLLEEVAQYEGSPACAGAEHRAVEGTDATRVKRAQVRRKIEDAIHSVSGFSHEPAGSPGAMLFVGKGRQRRLSDEGRVVRAHAEEILNSLRRLAEQATLDDGRWGGVRIAYRAVLWESLVGDWVRSWSRLAPSVPVEARGERAQMLDDHLESLDPDIAIQFDPPAPGPYASTVLWCEKLVLVANNTGLEGSQRVSCERGLGEQFIHVDRGKRYNADVRRLVARYLRLEQPRHEFTVQAHAMDCLFDTPGAVGYFSEHLLSARLREATATNSDFELTPLSAPSISRPVYLVYRARFGDPYGFSPSGVEIPGHPEPVDRAAFEALVGARREQLPAGLPADQLNTLLVRAMLHDLVQRAAAVSATVDDPLAAPVPPKDAAA